MTIGCGDRYIKLADVARPWFVDLTVEQEQEIFRKAGVSNRSDYHWITLHIVLDAKLRALPRRGYFWNHPKRLEVAQVVSVRFPELGETVEAAVTPAKQFRGYLLVGPESVGFVPLDQSDEAWWVVAHDTIWNQIEKHFRPWPTLGRNARLDDALVEIVGRVGPPGGYGPGDFNREIAIDKFKYLRPAAFAEMRGTAAISGDVKAAINLCKPQRQ